MPTLFIDSKNYGAACMAPGVALRHAGIRFEEVRLRAGDALRAHADCIAPVSAVPLLVDGSLHVWGTLPILEYLAERHPAHAAWPGPPQARARARSVCAELQSGFPALARHCGLNIEAPLRDEGCLIWRRQPTVRAEVRRITAAAGALLREQGGPYLFGEFCLADACFAPVCLQLKGYVLPLPSLVADYVRRLEAVPAVAAWVKGALAERSFDVAREPYRLARQ